MKKKMVVLIIVLSWQLSMQSKELTTPHQCHHFDAAAHAQNMPVDATKNDEPHTSEPPVSAALSQNFGKTHFIIGSSSQKVQEALQQESISQVDVPQQKAAPIINHDSYEHAYFAPDDALQKILLDLIAQEKSSIKIAVFFFTSKDIAQALLAAKERGVSIELVTDQSCKQDKSNKIKFLHQAGIPIYIYKPENTGTLFGNHMHHKFLIFDKNKEGKQLLWFGSYNLTKTANGNQEAVVVSDNQQLINQFLTQFDRLKNRSLSYKQKKSTALDQSKTPLALTKNSSRSKKRSIRRLKLTPKENNYLNA